MDNDPIVAGEDVARLNEAILQAEEIDEPAPEPELFELELDGEVHTLPAALKGAFLRQADYTRKTQELAEHRRALDSEREAFAREAAAGRSANRDRVRLALLDEQLSDFEGVDWDAFAAEDPEGAQALWGRFEAVAKAREELDYAVRHADERDQLRAARAAAEAMAKTGARLREEIDGWSPDVAARLVEYAQAFGVTLEELAEAADPRLWKLLHKAWKADEAASAPTVRADVRPAVVLAGGGPGGGSVRDELGTKEWMRRRNAQAGER
ncbi:MAG: hypothetical protein ACOY5Y_12745 [Pseudomonadota bacterium]